jgi:hypothetical protein
MVGNPLDNITLTAMSEQLGPVHQLQPGFLPDPEFKVFRAQDVRLVIARLEQRIGETELSLAKLKLARQRAEELR